MATILAADVNPGMTVRTIPSIASGRTTTDTFTVDTIEIFSIDEKIFVEFRHNGGGHVMGAEVQLDVVTDGDRADAWGQPGL